MNRRLVLIDQEETPNYVSYYGLGLGDEIYLLQSLNSMPQPGRERLLKLGEGDGVLLIGAEPFRYL